MLKLIDVQPYLWHKHKGLKQIDSLICQTQILDCIEVICTFKYFYIKCVVKKLPQQFIEAVPLGLLIKKICFAGVSAW